MRANYQTGINQPTLTPVTRKCTRGERVEQSTNCLANKTETIRSSVFLAQAAATVNSARQFGESFLNTLGSSLAACSPFTQLLWHTYSEYVFSCSRGVSQCRFSLSGICVRLYSAFGERNYGVNAELSKPRRFTVRGRPPISTLRSSIECYEFLRRVDLFAGKSSLDSSLVCTARE